MTTMSDWRQGWQRPLNLIACEECETIFLRPPEISGERCAACGQAGLTPLDAVEDKPAHTQPPELILPFKLSPTDIARPLADFARSFWFTPSDLTAERLRGRLQKVYLPLWLVDAQINALWSAETGFNYQVVSHREQYSDGRWRTEQVEETRIRWEQRAGRIEKEYHNQTAPALEKEAALQQRLGAHNLSAAQPFAPALLDEAVVQLPDRPPEDAWTDAAVGFQRQAMADCQRADQADHLREFHWSPDYANKHWTQLLRPLYTTYYLDDDNQPWPVLVHGATGKLYGRQRASMKRAKQTALLIGAAAALIFVVSLLLLIIGFYASELLLAAAALGLIAAVGTAAVALVPPLVVWNNNRRRES
jgi:hypothetical protein